MKEKMLIKIERDKLKNELHPKKDTLLPTMENKTKTNISEKSEKIKFTPFPSDETSTNPFLSKNIEPFNYKQTVLFEFLKAQFACN